MELLAGIKTRRSYRAFKSDPIPGEMIEQVLEAASRSPSYTNTQPWEVAVVTGEKKEELSRILSSMYESDVPGNSDLPSPQSWPPELDKRAKEHGARRYTALGVERADAKQRKELRLMNFKFYGAPCALFLFMEKSLTSWSIFDIGIFAQSLILAAHSLGLGTCLQASVVGYPDAIREFLGIPQSKLLVIAISMGYPEPEAPINTYQSTRLTPQGYARWYH
jgi:nitroreductase